MDPARILAFPARSRRPTDIRAAAHVAACPIRGTTTTGTDLRSTRDESASARLAPDSTSAVDALARTTIARRCRPTTRSAASSDSRAPTTTLARSIAKSSATRETIRSSAEVLSRRREIA